ncbi:hypothetical protein IQ265_18620 [Nodosilinea sp. LEGE 06152]|uniref:hypothetical protein n=1 Tax=Nodosilinea sp. LEGE 06152 TaxID=2777966 RepID=UPI00188229CC|nr:hypothetical protein [Nodosilinea sp. LEGE 06152]MBE9158833.1 hypothetical protein [Nodosilinea sp. LEGE 06152]
MTSLVAGQIVFLECRQTRLYAEVIQVLESRLTGWIRPLALVSETEITPLGTALGTTAPDFNQATVPDMLWPLDQLQPALDTEVIPLLATLSAKGSDPNPTPDPHQKPMDIGEFVRSLWADRQRTARSPD